MSRVFIKKGLNHKVHKDHKVFIFLPTISLNLGVAGWGKEKQLKKWLFWGLCVLYVSVLDKFGVVGWVLNNTKIYFFFFVLCVFVFSLCPLW